jgi:polyisoprenyl-phosphate glycosyltransferase
VRHLVRQLDDALRNEPVKARLLFVDDCSPTPAPPDLVQTKLTNIVSLESLRLRRNLGHQRAIAIGLSFIHAERPCDAVLIMDADGEDKPEDVPRLIQVFLAESRRKVIFAQRGRRSANWRFRIGYFLYRWGHRILTGIAVKVGNFSVIPAAHVETLVVVSDTWNHYAASVFKSRIPYAMLPTSRGKRLAGESKMNFVALVLHGLSAISVFAEIVGARLTLAILTLVAFLTALLLAVPVIRWGTDLAIPGWATTAAGLLLVIVLQMLTVALGLTLLVLFNRNNLSFLPIRDYRYFVGNVQNIYERAG